MSNRKTAVFYALLIAIASLAVGMVIASRLGLAPESAAQSVAVSRNSAPITGPLTATTFRDIAKTVTVLHEGSVLAEGTLDEVQANPKVVEVYLGDQHAKG